MENGSGAGDEPATVVVGAIVAFVCVGEKVGAGEKVAVGPIAAVNPRACWRIPLSKVRKANSSQTA
eukprot:5831958-Amphidinium_carterae.1